MGHKNYLAFLVQIFAKTLDAAKVKEHNYYIEQRNKEANEMNTYRVFGYNEGEEGLSCFTVEAYSINQAMGKAHSLIDFVTSIEKV